MGLTILDLCKEKVLMCSDASELLEMKNISPFEYVPLAMFEKGSCTSQVAINITAQYFSF